MMTTESTASMLLPRLLCRMENFIIIWLDFNINELSDSINQLRRSIFYSLQIFNESDQCIDFLSNIQNKQVFFIVSDSLAPTIVPHIHEMSQVYKIYIFGEKTFEDNQQWIKRWSKIKGVFMDISSIHDVLKQNLRRSEHNLEPISIVPQIVDVDLNQLDSSFMYSQLLKEMLLEMIYDKEAKMQFIQFCHEKYADDSTTLHAIDNFEQNYHLYSPIWWYTKEPFIYAVLNRALRMQDIEVILKMGFFVRDLHQQVEQLYSSTNQTENLILYRGQGMSNAEFERIKKNEGGLLAFNNFLSTSSDEQVSFAFAASSSDDIDLTGILFRIEISPIIASVPFASLNNISYYSDSEREILFSMHAVFRIENIQQIQERLWQIQLTLTSDNDTQLKCLTERIRYETRGQPGDYRLGTLMIKMSEFEKAELFFQTLIEKTPNDNWYLLSRLYNQLGLVYQNKGDGPNALIYLNKTLAIKKRLFSLDHPDFASTYNNIAMVHTTMGNYSIALSYYQKTLEIQEKYLLPAHSDLGTTYNNIGLLHRMTGNASDALLYFQKSLEIQQKCLPSTHPDLASTYCNIGTMHHFIGNYSTALSYFLKTLNIQQKSLPPIHPHLATIYNNIGMIYDAMEDYLTALSYYQMTLDIQEKILPSTHPDLAVSYSNMATIHCSMENYAIALEYFQKSVEIQEKILPSTHPSLATTYNNIGGVYDSMKESSIALSYYQKALQIEEKSLPSMHPTLALTYNNIGMAYDTMKDYTTALFYYQKALEIQRNSLPSDHPELASVCNNIGAVNYQLGEHSTAIKYYQMALEIREKILPSTHSDLVSIYSNIGVSYRLTGDYSAALIYFEKSVKVLEKSLSCNYRLLEAVYYNMAQTFEASHRLSEAIAYTSRAIDVISHTKEPNCARKQKYLDYLNKLQQKL